jgi:quercetin dioxygenase-like cupin family protein
LAELAKLTGFEASLLDDIENNNVQPQLGILIKLSKALDNALSRLLSDKSNQLYSITRCKDRKPITRTTSRSGKKKTYSYVSLATEVQGRHMEPLAVLLEEDADPETSVHSGEEFIHVLEGNVVLQIDKDQFVLEDGDSAYYVSTLPHRLTAQGGRATILATIYCD